VKLVTRLVLAFAAVAALSVGITGVLAYRAAADRIPRALANPNVMRGGGPPETAGLGARGQEVLLAQLREANLQAAIVALLAAVLVGAAVAVGVTRPLGRLTSVTRRYGRGERDARAELRGHDEVAELGRAFDAAADRLQAEQDLKQRFTTDVAHELRTPLTILRSELEAMQDGLMEADPPRLAALLEQVELLTRLVQDLRTLTLAEAGELTLEPVPLDLTQAARAAAEAFAAAAAARGVELRVEGDSVRVRADPDRVRQIVVNLLDNALRHAREGGRVRVTTSAEAGEAVLRVEDDGAGIPEQDLPYLFERFYRIDAARRRGDGGSGLGLSIVAALARLHGGSARAENLPTGGARLTVRLPG
jgi:two-component system sensor histidine kinase BaeS